MTYDRENETAKQSLLKELSRRRFFRIMGLYLAACWGIVEFVDWVVNRYLFSPHWVDLSLLVVLSLTPAAALMAWFHGKPGRDSWQRSELIAISANLLVTSTLVLVLFVGKDLGAVSQQVTAKDETGKTIQRMVPKSQYRKKIALFFMENVSKDKSIDWLQYGVTYMLEYDLFQDLYISLVSPFTISISSESRMYKKLIAGGYKKGLGIPLLFKKKITSEFHMDYFFCGKIDKIGDEYILDSEIYSSRDAEIIARQSFRSKDIFSLLDRLAIQIKHDLEIPVGHIRDATDLPLAESFTGSLDAARLIVEGQLLMSRDKNWSAAQRKFEAALKQDPTFAVAYQQLAFLYLLTNKNDKLPALYKKLMKLLYKLPERNQHLVKVNYYAVDEQMDKVMAVLAMMTQLFPDDIVTLSTKGLLLVLLNRIDEAIAVFERILLLDPDMVNSYKALGGLYEQKGNLDTALNYFLQYSRRLPHDTDSQIVLGGYYKRRGELKLAKEYYEKAVLMEPHDYVTLNALAGIEIRLGNLGQASQLSQEALTHSKTQEDKQLAYSRLSEVYSTKGQMKKSLHYIKLRNDLHRKHMAPFLAAWLRLTTLGDYVRAGHAKEAFKEIEEIKKQLKPPYDKFVAIGYSAVYLELEQPAQAEKWLPPLQALYDTYKTLAYQGILLYTKGNIYRLRGKYEEAIRQFEQLSQLQPTEMEFQYRIAMCCRHLKQFDKALKIIETCLKNKPFEPEFHYENALILLESGRKEEAKKHLEIAVNTWNDADRNFKPAQVAVEKLAEIKNQ